MSKDCEIWPVLDNWVVFQVAVVFLTQDSPCMKQEQSSVSVCHVPSVSLFCIHHGEVVQNLLATWARHFHMTNQAAAYLPAGAERIQKPYFCRWATASALGLLLPHSFPQPFICPVLSTQLSAPGFFLLLMFQKD